MVNQDILKMHKKSCKTLINKSEAKYNQIYNNSVEFLNIFMLKYFKDKVENIAGKYQMLLLQFLIM